MIISDLLSNNLKPKLLTFEKNINNILNEIKSFNPKTSHQIILSSFKNSALNPPNFTAKYSEKNIQTLKNIYAKLQNIEYYKEHPKELENVQKEISSIIKKFSTKSPAKDIINDIKNELKNFSPQNSPKKIEKSINQLLEKFSKIPTNDEPHENINFADKIIKHQNASLNKTKTNIKEAISLPKHLEESIKTDIKDLLNKLEKIDFYKNRPKILQNIKENLNTILDSKPHLISNNNKQIIQNLYQKATILLDIKKDTPQVQELIKNIETILEKDIPRTNLQIKLKDIENSFEKLKTIFSNEQKVKDILNSIQKDLKTLLKSLNVSPKQKEFSSHIKDILIHFKTGKVKLLNQSQIVKNIGNITKNLDKIILSLPKDEKYTPVKEELSKFSKDIKQIDLKQNIKNSGILYESKLLNSIDEKNLPTHITKTDVKGILLTLKNDPSLKQHTTIQNNIENTLTQINAVQINALIGENFTSYIPFAWDNLKDGYFSIAKLKKEDGFSCKIELDLKNYGKVDILMLFHNEMLSMKIDIKDNELENILKKESLSLQKALKKLGFETSIFFSKKSKQNSYSYENYFTNTLDMDIKA